MDINNDMKSPLSYSIKSGYFLSGVIVALLVWIVDPFINAVFLQEGSIYQQLVHPDASELYSRSVISAVILIMSFMGSVLLNRSRQAEERIVKSKKMLSDAQLIAKFGSWELNVVTMKIHWSDSLYEIFGFDQNYIQPSIKSLFKVVYPEDLGTLKKHIFTTSINDRPTIAEFRIIKPDKSFCVIQSHATLECDENDSPLRLIGTVQDITERKKAEELLMKREIQLSESQSVSRLGSWDMDLISQTLDWSEETYRLCDKSPELYTPSYDEFARMVHPDDLEIMLTVWNRTVAGSDKPYHLNIRLINDTGREWVMEAFARIERDENNNVIRIFGTAQDITERKQAEEELQILSRAVEYSSSAVYITDLDGNIEYINPKFTEITGYSKEDVIGENPRLLKSGETLNEVYVDMWATITSGREWKGEFHNRKKDGSLYWGRNSISGVKNSEGVVTHYVAIQDDMTQEYELTEQLSYQASHDALTGLINRREFERRAERLLSTLQQDKTEHALCFMDLDQFKIVNDTCGHIAGDELLRQIAMILQHEVRRRDTLVRLGGDEFAVLMEHCSLDQANRLASSLLMAVQNFQFSWEGHSFNVGVSIGVVAITGITPNLTELLKQADAACYMAKDLGRNRIHVYRTEDKELVRRHGQMQWVERVYQALNENRFCLYAQVIEPLDNNTGKHYELLIRMKDKNGEIILPGAFLPAAERYNLIGKLDRWVIGETFDLLTVNPDFVEQINFISINLSGESLADDNILNLIITQLNETGIDGSKICFEITETAAISNLSFAIKFISTLKDLGCRFALDDFGSGLSSFRYLKNLPVDYLKIDGMFVKNIVKDPIDRAMVKSINEIGKVMGMKTIAEFVENDEIKDMLREIGVNYAQGYGIGRPLPFDELLDRSSNVIEIRK